jgi:transcriptional regulator with XRE-family HTH domain
MTQTRLKQLREDAVLTVHELAKASGVSDDTISKIENGQRVARPATLRKLASALDVSPQELRRPAKVEEPVLAGKAEAPREAGPEDGETPVSLSDAEVLSTVAALWEAQLSRGLYDVDTLRKMYITAGVLVMNHVSNVGESRENLRPDLLAQLEAAEERFAAVDNQVLEILEKIPRGHAAPQDELDKKRRERFQEMRGVPQARHA